MTRQSLGKQILIFLIGTVINLILFSLSKYAGFPFWTDYTGSFIITALAGPVLGTVSVIIHTLILTILIDGIAALWLLIPMLCVATVISLFVKSGSFDTAKGYFLCVFLSSTVAGTVTAITMIFAGVTGRYAVYAPVYTALHESIGKVAGSIILASGIAAVELLISFAVMTLVMTLMPRQRDGLSFK